MTRGSLEICKGLFLNRVGFRIAYTVEGLNLRHRFGVSMARTVLLEQT